MKKLIAGAMLVSLAAVLAAGCGGSSRNKAYANDKAAFAAAVNSVCAKVNAAQKAVKINTLQDIVNQGPALQKTEAAAVKKLKSLVPPDAVKSNYDHLLSVVSQATDDFGKIIAAAKKNDTAKVNQLGGELNTLVKSADPDANAIGAPACLSTATQ
jgi:hypothetical protein